MAAAIRPRKRRVVVCGELDRYTAPRLREALTATWSTEGPKAPSRTCRPHG
ncbi:MAG TPA: hypothetical protein VGJ45_17785 [Pseudonocardiaceae bacterium]